VSANIFQVTESAPELSYYGPRKVKFIPFLIIQLQGCFVDFVMHGARMLNVQTGVSRVTIEPYGNCFCGVKDTPTSTSSVEIKTNQKVSKQMYAVPPIELLLNRQGTTICQNAQVCIMSF
jgi:hypothetical protein